MKNDIIQGAGQLGQYDISWGHTDNTGMPPDKKVNNAE